jgi:restriction system protein
MSTRRFVVTSKTLPDLPGMMLATLDALRQIGGSASIEELNEKVVEVEGVTEEEQALLMSNEDPRTRVNYYLAWARTYLKRGGAIANSARGIWSLTEIGRQMEDYAETRAIYEQVTQEERDRARVKRLAAKSESRSSAPQPEYRATAPSEIADDSAAESDAQANWKIRLLEVLGTMAPAAFERLAQRLLRESGFTKVEVRGKSGDGGVDGVGILRVNLVSFQVYFQCKRWKGSVPANEIRDFRGAMQGRADKGLFITTGRFTAQASDESTRDGAIAIDLIDGERLCDLLKQYSLGVRTELIEQVIVNSDWFSGV